MTNKGNLFVYVLDSQICSLLRHEKVSERSGVIGGDCFNKSRYEFLKGMAMPRWVSFLRTTHRHYRTSIHDVTPRLSL
jgi:hypothetical protein